MCDVVDLSSWSLTFSLLVCDLQVTGMHVPEIRYQPAPIDPVAWLEGASLQFSQPKSLWVGREPTVTHIGALLYPCCAPKLPCYTGCGGEELGWQGVHPGWQSACLSQDLPQLPLWMLPQPVPCSAVGLCSNTLAADFLLFEHCIVSNILPLLDAAFSSLGLDALLPPV